MKHGNGNHPKDGPPKHGKTPSHTSHAAPHIQSELASANEKYASVRGKSLGGTREMRHRGKGVDIGASQSGVVD